MKDLAKEPYTDKAQATKKKSYQAPRLTVYGTIRTLTQNSGSGMATDGSPDSLFNKTGG